MLLSTSTVIIDSATLGKQLAVGYTTSAQFTDYDKVSGKPLIMTDQGNIFPTPYATLPMDEQVSMASDGNFDEGRTRV